MWPEPKDWVNIRFLMFSAIIKIEIWNWWYLGEIDRYQSEVSRRMNRNNSTRPAVLIVAVCLGGARFYIFIQSYYRILVDGEGRWFLDYIYLHIIISFFIHYISGFLLRENGGWFFFYYVFLCCCYIFSTKENPNLKGQKLLFTFWSWTSDICLIWVIWMSIILFGLVKIFNDDFLTIHLYQPF